MASMSTIFAYTLDTAGATLDAALPFALKLFHARFGRQPVAIWLHPARIADGPWPADWPPVYPNDKMNRNIIGLEVGAPADEPQQLRLI